MMEIVPKIMTAATMQSGMDDSIRRAERNVFKARRNTGFDSGQTS
jgi:hypothetical protein